MNGWAPKSVGIVQAVTANQTNLAISREFPITASGSRNLVVAIKTSATTVAAAITAKLQTAVNGTYQDSKTVSVTGNGYFFIKLNVEVAGDQTYLPLLNSGKVVITTGAGDAVTIDSVDILQGE